MLTREEFEELRNAAHAELARHDEEHLVDWRLLPVLQVVPPRAGTWLRPRCVTASRSGGCDDHPDGWVSAAWHLFDGDLAWRAAWPRVATEAACGYQFGELSDCDARDLPPRDLACRSCLARAGG